MKITLTIDLNSTEMLTYNIQDDTIYLTFNSVDEYQKFLEKPFELLPDEFDTEDEKKIYAKINANLKGFCTLLSQEVIHLWGITLKFDLSKLPNQPLEVDLKDLNLEEEIKLLNEHYWENITFHDAYNTLHDCTKEELLDTYHKLSAFASTYKKYDLSPLETTLIVFDLVRTRLYNNPKKDNALPRDLSCILKSSDIVCLGYVNLFRALCEILGVETDTLFWHNNSDIFKDGHASVVAYINDPKYNVKGIFAFEPTWSSIKPKIKDTYMDNYSLAFQSLSLEISRKKSKDLVLSPDNIMFIIDDNVKRLERLISLNAPEIILNDEKKLLLERINIIKDMLGEEPLEIIDSNNLEPLKKVIKSFKNPNSNMISLQTFMNLIKAVRDIENEIDPETYKKDKAHIDTAIATSVSFKQYNEYSNLLDAIFGKSRKRKKS